MYYISISTEGGPKYYLINNIKLNTSISQNIEYKIGQREIYFVDSIISYTLLFRTEWDEFTINLFKGKIFDFAGIKFELVNFNEITGEGVAVSINQL